MKSIALYFSMLAFIYSSAQDISDMTLVAHYTFIETASDIVGNHGDAEIVNAPFQGEDGIYSYGGYLFDVINEDSSLVGSADIPALNDSAFAVQVSFKN